MKKISLDLDSLKVDSFVTSPRGAGTRGTVHGQLMVTGLPNSAMCSVGCPGPSDVCGQSVYYCPSMACPPPEPSTATCHGQICIEF